MRKESTIRSQDSSLSIVMHYRLDGQDLIPGKGKICLFSTAIRPLLEAHPASYPVSNGEISLEVKWPGHKADHSPPSSAEVKNGGAIPPHPHMSLCHIVLN
jgi:hypothetical protein